MTARRRRAAQTEVKKRQKMKRWEEKDQTKNSIKKCFFKWENFNKN